MGVGVFSPLSRMVVCLFSGCFCCFLLSFLLIVSCLHGGVNVFCRFLWYSCDWRSLCYSHGFFFVLSFFWMGWQLAPIALAYLYMAAEGSVFFLLLIGLGLSMLFGLGCCCGAMLFWVLLVVVWVEAEKFMLKE